MLRSQLGEELYRRCIKTYLERHQYDTVVTEDLNAVLEELSGRSYDQFFDQWVYHAHHPELDVSYSWDERGKLAKLSVAQNQKLSDTVLLFRFPLTIGFKTAAGKVERHITVKEKSEDFYFALPEAPKLVRVDPHFTLLAKVKFAVPESMLHEQLTEADDVIGRVLAVEQLSSRKDRATVEKLKALLQKDPFHGVRSEAARALRGIHTDEAFAALKESLDQPDARVRQQVVRALGGHYRDEACAALQLSVEQEKNPDIVAVAARALGAYAKPLVREALLRLLKSESYRNTLADAAIGAIRAQDDPSYLEPLRKALEERQADFTSSGFGAGLETLAHLARNQENKDAVREFLLGQVQHRTRRVQLAAIRALGNLGDPKALAVLETFVAAPKESPEREAADRALAALRAVKKPNDEWRDLRNEVLDLKKANREMRNELEQLKKKVEAGVAKESTPSESKPRRKPREPKSGAR
jgi:aminopeptidase N